MLSYRGSKSLKMVKYWTFFKLLFLHFSESESAINSKDLDPYFTIYGSGSTTLLTICSTRIECIRSFFVSLRRRSRRSSRMRRPSPGVSWPPGMNPSGWSRRGESNDLSVSTGTVHYWSKSQLVMLAMISHYFFSLSKLSLVRYPGLPFTSFAEILWRSGS
jgi:hypothetical protein